MTIKKTVTITQILRYIREFLQISNRRYGLSFLRYPKFINYSTILKKEKEKNQKALSQNEQWGRPHVLTLVSSTLELEDPKSLGGRSRFIDPDVRP